MGGGSTAILAVATGETLLPRGRLPVLRARPAKEHKKGAHTGIDGYINFFDPADKTPHHRMAALVERKLELNKRRGGLRPPAARKQTGAQRAPLPPEADRPEREIAATDTAIDELAYKLYGITDEGQRKTIENM